MKYFLRSIMKDVGKFMIFIKLQSSQYITDMKLNMIDNQINETKQERFVLIPTQILSSWKVKPLDDVSHQSECLQVKKSSILEYCSYKHSRSRYGQNFWHTSFWILVRINFLIILYPTICTYVRVNLFLNMNEEYSYIKMMIHLSYDIPFYHIV